MLLTDIQRTKAGVAVAERELGSCERDQLALQAKAKLGYQGLASDVTGTKTLAATSGALTEALLRLEIKVLDSNQVVKYQVEEAGRVTLEAIQRRFADWIKGWFSAASWTYTALSSYSEPIPEFVIRKAIQIKDACPEVQFFIQHMSDPKADPFLVAVLDREIYYIEAWAEPRFEAML